MHLIIAKYVVFFTHCTIRFWFCPIFFYCVSFLYYYDFVVVDSTDETDSEGDTTKAEGTVVHKSRPESQPPRLRNTKAYSFGTSIEACEYSTKVRWQMSSAITTQHLLSVISIANTLMSMSRASFLMVHHQVQQHQPKRYTYV